MTSAGQIAQKLLGVKGESWKGLLIRVIIGIITLINVRGSWAY
jgi:hypothetical protein